MAVRVCRCRIVQLLPSQQLRRDRRTRLSAVDNDRRHTESHFRYNQDYLELIRQNVAVAKALSLGTSSRNSSPLERAKKPSPHTVRARRSDVTAIATLIPGRAHENRLRLASTSSPKRPCAPPSGRSGTATRRPPFVGRGQAGASCSTTLLHVRALLSCRVAKSSEAAAPSALSVLIQSGSALTDAVRLTATLDQERIHG
jgi:hypothetical protein